jgi:hypothetical protein
MMSGFRWAYCNIRFPGDARLPGVGAGRCGEARDKGRYLQSLHISAESINQAATIQHVLTGTHSEQSILSRTTSYLCLRETRRSRRNGRVRVPHRRVNPSVSVLAQVGSETRNVRVQTRPSRPSTHRKRVRVQALSGPNCRQVGSNLAGDP